MDLVELCQSIRELCEEINSRLTVLTENLRVVQPKAQFEQEKDLLLDYHEVCEVLHISIRQLRRLLQSEELVGVKIGRRRFYPTSEVQAYIRRLSRQSQTQNDNQ